MDDMLHLRVSGDTSPDALKSNQIVIKRVQNMPIRGNVWPLQSTVVHAKKNVILISDVRGEVYMCNLLSNKYHHQSCRRLGLWPNRNSENREEGMDIKVLPFYEVETS